MSGILVWLFLQLASFQMDAQDLKKIDIRGRLSTNYNGPIYLRYEIIPDSTLSYEATVVDGKFSFRINLVEPVASILSLPSQAASEYLYLDTSAMTINANIDSSNIGSKSIKFLRIVSVDGSKSESVYKQLMIRWRSITESGLSVKLQADYLFATLDSLVKLYPDYIALTQALLFAEVLSYDQALAIYNQLSIRQKNRANTYGINKMLARLKRTDIGTVVVLKDLKNEIGDPITLEDISSSVILLDFWSSSCSPCRAMHPEMKKLFAKYHSKGFTIIGISLDTDREKWLKAVKDDNIDWINASDLKGYYGYVASSYGLNYVPFNLLIDEHSQIISKNVTLNDLQTILLEKLHKPSIPFNSKPSE